MKDTYYEREEVSNSMLTELKKQLYPDFMSGIDPTRAFHLGTLVDGLVTEPENCDHIRKLVGDEQYTDKEWEWGLDMYNKLVACGRPIVMHAMLIAEKQKVMVNKGQQFEYQGVRFELDTRCKWDFWFGGMGFGADLKTTAATSQKSFEKAVDMFDWDRSRAWYMDIAGSDKDVIIAISKNTKKVFFKVIERGDETYERGKEKYLELAFKYWTLKI